MIDHELVIRKVHLIQEDLERLQAYEGLAPKDLENDYQKEALIERYLERIITRAIDLNQHLAISAEKPTQRIPKDYKESFLVLSELEVYPYEFGEKISGSAGFRNALVHEYDDLDKKKFYQSMKAAIEQYPQYCQYVLDYLEKQNETA